MTLIEKFGLVFLILGPHVDNPIVSTFFIVIGAILFFSLCKYIK